MPGFLVNASSTVNCSHAGSARATMTNPRVKLDGQPSVVQSSVYSVSQCSFTTSAGPSPCVTATWTVVATRVRSSGQGLVLQDSQATCTPNGTPLTVAVTQQRVKGT
jgi:hypothetical protein